MALVVEDGSGVAGANSFVSEAEASAFFAARGLGFDDYEAKLLRAMDELMAHRYAGTRTHIVNNLPFPRTGISDVYGNDYSSEEVPESVKLAQLWLSYYIGQGFDPSGAYTIAVKREKVSKIEVEYVAGEGGKSRLSLSDLPNVYNVIKHLLFSSVVSGGICLGETSRA